MAAIRISSRKIDTRNGRAAHHFAGDFHSDVFGIVFSGDALILNMTDGERTWSAIFDEESTAKLAQRFASRPNKTRDDGVWIEPGHEPGG